MNNQERSLTKKNDDSNSITPTFVSAEQMFERLADITRQTDQKAYDFFQGRGASVETHLEDWLKAESVILRPTPVEITETENAVNIRAAVPGFKPDEIEISVKDNLLILSGETKSEKKPEDKNPFYSEWHSNRFFRRLTLPCEVKAENVEAHLKDGVLQMTFKKIESEEATKIAVKTA